MSAQPASDSQKKLFELLDLLRDVSERRYGPEWGIETLGDVADGHRNLLHLLEGALYSHKSADPERPVFRRIVSPTRKFRGDNSDAIYFDAALRGDRDYIVRGSMAGAVYFSVTIEEGEGEGLYATGTAAGLYDADMHFEPNGDFEILVSPNDPGPGKNWLALTPNSARITTRHYFEEAHTVAADPSNYVPMTIAPLVDPGSPPAWSPEGIDASTTASIQRVINFIKSETLDQPPRKPEEQPGFVSTTPNVFNPPEKPGDLAFSAMDIAYAMCPYVVGPDQALVMTGRFPECRFANVCLWDRYIQSYDFNNRSVSLNRKQTQLEADGSFKMIIAHSDPGLPNWLDTEGRPFGIVYWRFLLPEGEIETPQIEVVDFASLAG